VTVSCAVCPKPISTPVRIITVIPLTLITVSYRLVAEEEQFCNESSQSCDRRPSREVLGRRILRSVSPSFYVNAATARSVCVDVKNGILVCKIVSCVNVTQRNN
jgi:hypothetical protein